MFVALLAQLSASVSSRPVTDGGKIRILENARRYPNGSISLNGRLVKPRVYSPNSNPRRRKRLLERRKDTGSRERRRAALIARAALSANNVEGNESNVYEDDEGPLVDYVEVRSEVTASDIFQEILDLVNASGGPNVSNLMEESPEKADDVETELECDVGLTPQARDFVGELQASRAASVDAIVQYHAYRFIHAVSGKRKKKASANDDVAEDGEGEDEARVVDLENKAAVQAIFDSRIGPWAIKSAVSST